MPAHLWSVPGRDFRAGAMPFLMGILNVTPDSFSDGGRYAQVETAVAQGLKLIEEGADILDVGGESTRPQSTPVPEDEELRRVVPVIRRLAAETSTPISIDTTKSAVAKAALDAGAVIVNDISGLTFDPLMIDVCRSSGAAVVCMHIQGTPQTMQDDPHYEDVVTEVTAWLERRLEALESQGIARERICLDPGIGFGKTARHNLELLSHVGRFHEMKRPVLIGHSRKRFVGKILGRPVDERSLGTVGISLALACQGADILRLHDVRATRDALLAFRAVVGPPPA